jgi:nucleoside-diphosphate-sugar epimerase
MACLRIAIENPPADGEYRVFNQFENAYTITELAEMVQEVGAEIGLDVEIKHYDNPRTELEEHYYNPDRQHLIDLGYQPTHDIKSVMKETMLDLIENKDRIEAHIDALVPDIRWDSSRKKSEIIDE